LLRAPRELLLCPCGLLVLEAVLVVRRVEPQDAPVVVDEREEARRLAVARALAREARVGERGVEEGVAAGVHVVVAVQVPRRDRLAALDRPVLQEAAAV